MRDSSLKLSHFWSGGQDEGVFSHGPRDEGDEAAVGIAAVSLFRAETPRLNLEICDGSCRERRETEKTKCSEGKVIKEKQSD